MLFFFCDYVSCRASPGIAPAAEITTSAAIRRIRTIIEQSNKPAPRFIITTAASDYVTFALLSVFSQTSKPVFIFMSTFLVMQYMCMCMCMYMLFLLPTEQTVTYKYFAAQVRNSRQAAMHYKSPRSEMVVDKQAEYLIHRGYGGRASAHEAFSASVNLPHPGQR